MKTETKGGSTMKPVSNVYKQAAVVVAGTACILMIPLVAMQFSEEVNWTLSDFVVAGVLLLGTGLTYVVIANKVNKRYRMAVGLGLLFMLLWLWVELAVGLFTNWGS